MTPTERAREFFSKDRYATEQTGIVIEDAKKGYARCSIALDARHCNALGHVMGGVAFTLADFVFAIASNFESDTATVTTTSQISYFSAPKGKRLYGESVLLRDGKRTCFYRVDITDDLGTAVAGVNITGAHLPKNR